MNRTQLNYASNTLNDIRNLKLAEKAKELKLQSRGVYNDLAELDISNLLYGHKGFIQNKMKEIKQGKAKLKTDANSSTNLFKAFTATTEAKLTKFYEQKTDKYKEFRTRINMKMEQINLKIALGKEPEIMALIEEFKNFK